MAHLLLDLKNYFEFDEINIDSWTFKLYYRFSCAICMLGATVGVASQYFGDPISCQFSGVDQDLAEGYCWIHGSTYIPKEYQPHLKCILDQEGMESEDDAPDTAFYQWVTFMMALQAAIFYLPYRVWAALEGGLLNQFGTEGSSRVLLRSETKCEDGVVMEAVVEKFVKYFKSIHHHNSWYYAYFIACEMSNHFLLGLQFYLTDVFLYRKFSSYGWDTLEYFSHPLRERVSMAGGMRNPMCSLFPTEVSCNIPTVGAGGDEQDNNGLCVLTQNIINEKIYLLLWFWYMFVVVWSTLSVFVTISILSFDSIRFGLIYNVIRHKYDKSSHKCLKYLLTKCHLGDWFVLYQLSKNCNKYFYREFIKELAIELKRRPKKSKGRLESEITSAPASPSAPKRSKSPAEIQV